MEAHAGAAAVTSTDDAPRPTTGWLVSPAFDSAFLANLWWPLVVALGWWLTETDSWFGFWQIYFLTTPHRWLTLFLVATDPDRRGNKTAWLVGIAVVATAVVLSVWYFTQALTCLALIDYLWNAWHFGSQHGGIARMYSRRAGEVTSRGQTWGLRILVVYTAVRLAGWSTGWLEATAQGEWILLAIDWLVGAGCVLFILLGTRRSALSRVTYLASVVTIYLALLVAVNFRITALVAALVAASAAFHAIEYIAIVTFYAQRRQTQGSRGLFQAMARNWLALLCLYMVLIGSLAFFTDQRWREAWLAINLIAAFLHYAYDGMIWKLREKATSQTLGTQLTAVVGDRL